MAGTNEGGQAAARTNKRKYGSDLLCEDRRPGRQAWHGLAAFTS